MKVVTAIMDGVTTIPDPEKTVKSSLMPLER